MGQKAATRAASAAASMPAPGVSESRVLGVDDRVDRLTLIVQAMWEVLEDSGQTEEALRAKIEEIDARDGASDGKIQRQPVKCSQCGSSSPAGRPTCQMCGNDLENVDSFGSV